MERPLLRSMLFVPGDQPRMLAKAPTLEADAVILDVEDGVTPKDKGAARTGIEDALLACLWPGLGGVVVPRTQVAVTAHAVGCEAIDIVYTRVRDADGFRRECEDGRRLGYTGKQVVHPSQIAPANAAFSPTEDDVAWARRIVDAYRAAPRGALVVDGQMIDAPIVAQAEQVLRRARRRDIAAGSS